jgi:site-specific DNA recombinase
MKAAIYARFSTDKQREASIEDQKRVCRDYAKRENLTIVRIFSDEGESGSNAERPGYLEMLAAARNDEFNVILCEDVSRLWRDEVEQPRCVAELRFYDKHIIGINDGIDTRREGYEFLLAVKGAQNAGYRKDIGKRTHRGLAGKALNGEHTGGKAYGYRSTYTQGIDKRTGRPAMLPTGREIDPDQAKWVRFIFQQYAQGHAPRTIARELNARKVASPGSTWKRTKRRCGGWMGSAISNMLRNPLYTGEQVWNRSRWVDIPDTVRKAKGYKGKKQRKERPQAEWIVTEDPKLRIVDPRTWNAVQARLADLAAKNKAIQAVKGRKAHYSPRPKYLFSGLLKCGLCGANFVMLSYYQFGCPSARDGACANRLRVPRKLAEQELLKAVKQRLFTPARLEAFRLRTARLLAEHKRAARPDLTAVGAQFAEEEQKIGRLVRAIEDGAYSPALKAKLAEAEAERERLQAMLNTDTATLDKVAEFLPRAVDRYREMVDNLETVAMRDVPRARMQLRQLLGEVPLMPSATGDYLEAKLAGDYAGLVKLAAGNRQCNWIGSGGRI